MAQSVEVKVGARLASPWRVRACKALAAARLRRLAGRLAGGIVIEITANGKPVGWQRVRDIGEVS